ncbi:uncharacterized protein EI90DRAFT_3021311 [Cantharellus anzutake]|uniref:uncharacterized protein n=1 Tax=Cantharellus anzutake TaxID=1750568 RepID=UPI001903A4A0|nr:uncharacterized protein EI90DRAFT_3021311 [Cantharellus anzutake]KAF8317529.1 hypothetical protein EI90DRAFT_3021311 [Cantharellus anzutake]
MRGSITNNAGDTCPSKHVAACAPVGLVDQLPMRNPAQYPSGLGQALYFLRELYHANKSSLSSFYRPRSISTSLAPVRKPVACCILEKDTWYNNCTDADLPKQTSLRLVTAVFDALADSSSIPPEFWPQFSSGHPAGRAPMNLWGTFPKAGHQTQ